MNIKQQIEPNYNISKNGADYSEVIFELTNGDLYKGARNIKQSPVQNRREFKKWLADEHDDRFAFEQIEQIGWHYDARNTVQFNSRGQLVKS